MKPPLPYFPRMVLVCVIFQAVALSAFAQDWNQIIKVTASNNGGSSSRSTGDNYGYSVAISGNYAIVGAMNEQSDGNGLNNVLGAGAAYILFNDAGNWVQIKKITAGVRVFSEVFGISVAIDGDYAVVGAFLDDKDASETNAVQDAGSAYIFKKDQGGTDNWGQIKKVTAPVQGIADQFGNSVSISGDYVIVGAFNEDEDGDEVNTLNDAGSVYIFKKDAGGADNWGQIKKICAGIRGADDWFGVSVSINGAYAAVGAYREDEDASEANALSASGAAYIFKMDEGGPDNWGQVKKITASIRAAGDNFGNSVSINGDYLIVGAPGEDEDVSEANSLNSAGAAYIFKKDQGGTGNWGQFRKLVPTIRAANDAFGFAVCINGPFAIVGAQAESEDASEVNSLNRAGGAYIFQRDQGGADVWGQEQKIVAGTRALDDEFGISVSVSGNFAIVGAWQEDEDASEANTILSAGSAYIFETSGPLPVTLATFEAVRNENRALLVWTTTAEHNSAYFDIQRSNDGRAWKTLARVQAAVSSDGARSYSYTDSELDEDLPNRVNLYRLKMADMDGSFAYSKIVSLSFGKSRRAILFPNPTSDKLYINPADAAEIESVTVTNLLGQMVLQPFADAKAGISLNHLAPGIYVGQIRKKGGAMEFQKVVVGR